MKKKILLVTSIALLALAVCFVFVFCGIFQKNVKFEYTVNDDNKTCTITGMEESLIRKVTIPSEIDGYTVTSIGDSAFSDYTNIQEITIPDSVTSIGDNAFHSCIYLKRVTIPNSVTYIGQATFRGCSSLTSIVIPDAVTSIWYSAFYGCSSLTSIVIPDGVTHIYSEAFRGCSSLVEITIPDSVASIGVEVFEGCSNLKYNEYDNGYYLGNQSNPYLVLVKAKETAIKSLQINKSTKIISSAFADCANLRDITIPENVTYIGSEAFLNCTNLGSIKIPHSVTSIGSSAFEDCSSLTSIAIPNSVTSIDGSAFSGDSRLTDVYFSGTEEEWKSIDIELYGNKNLLDATIHYNSLV